MLEFVRSRDENRKEAAIWHSVFLIIPRRDVQGQLVGPGRALRRRVGAAWQYCPDDQDDRKWFAEW